MSLPLGKYDFNFNESADRKSIFDIVRKKFVNLTPEEFVRQHLLYYLHYDKKYSLSLMRSEFFLMVNDTPKRCDVLVFNSAGETLLLAECKAASEPIDFTTFEQMMIYNQEVQAKYFLLTNGSITYIASHENGKLEVLDDIPMCTSNI
ncbi:MAG: type I restriction enzyme HsdR N-terminal domain-containing protein [Bacteroidota bacterium]